MRIVALLAALFSAATEPAWAADLAKIDRTIHKEPTYQGKPKYCLLVFGAEAKSRIWLVQDGASVYVDRNGNGDLTEPGEKVVWKGDVKTMDLGRIDGKDGKLRGNVTLRKYQASVRLTVADESKPRYMVGDPDSHPLVFADRPAAAPIVHIGGPPAIELSYYDRLNLRVRVGTAGLGKGTFAALVLPEVTPIAEIAFPAKQPGGAPILVKAELKDR